MWEPLLPGLTVLQHGHLRNAWNDHVDAGLPVPSVETPLATYEVEKLERDYARWAVGNVGKEVERRLGMRVVPNYRTADPSAGRRAEQNRDFMVGLRAVIRMLATGKDFGADDLQALVNGGPADPAYADVFDGAVKDFMLAQQHLCVGRKDRVVFAPEPTQSHEPHLPGFGFGLAR